MGARSGDARMRSARAHRTRLLRHSAVADALANAPDEHPRPPRRVAGQRASGRRKPLASASREPAAMEPVPGPVVAERRSDARDLLAPYYDHEPTRLDPVVLRRMIVAACAVGVLAAGGVTTYVLAHRSPTHSATPQPTTSAPVRQAETWIRGNVPRTASLRADSTVAADLVSAGYSGVRLDVPFGSAGSFLVTTAENRARTARNLAHVAARISSLPVATFGSGQQRVDVSLLVAGSARSLPSRLSRERVERTAADRSLLSNPRLAVPATLRPWLVGGRLDLRAATVIALLAARTDVHVVQISLDPAEAAAARRARTVALAVTDRAALTEVLRALPTSYAPTRASTLPSGVRQLTWPVGLAPEGLF
jgi:hypothetical protein